MEKAPESGRLGKSAAGILALSIAVAHVAATWGYAGLWWGDHGRWLHEVDRFSQGQVPYRDFYWPYPPLSMWLVGGLARLFGSNFATVSVITAIIFVSIVWLFYVYARRLVDAVNLLLTIAAAVLLATAYAQAGGAPLPLGSYTPAMPVGFLFLIAGVLLVMDESVSPIKALALGALVGMCVLTKQDFWLPGAALLVIFTILHRGRPRLFAAAFASCATVVGAGALAVAVQSGMTTVLGIPGGFGQLEQVGRGYPTWERLTAELIAASLLVTAVGACVAVTGRTRRSFAVTASALIVAAAGSVIYLINAGGSPRALLGAIEARIFPAALPVLALGVLGLRWHGIAPDRRPLLVLLLSIAIVARTRRLFEGVEWFNILLELPIYVFLLDSIFPVRVRRQAVTLLLLLTLGVGFREYWRLGRGLLTQKNGWQWVKTAHGSIRLPAHEAADYRWLRGTLDARDPAGQIPVFGFGYSGAFSYFLGRGNPVPITQGFGLSLWPTDSLLNRIRDSKSFLIDVGPMHRVTVASPKLNLRRWRMQGVESHYTLLDAPLFEQLANACHELDRRPSGAKRPFLTVFDCQ